MDDVQIFDQILTGLENNNETMVETGLEYALTKGGVESLDHKHKLVRSNIFRNDWSKTHDFGQLSICEIAKICSENPESIGYSEDHKSIGRYLCNKIDKLKTKSKHAD